MTMKRKPGRPTKPKPVVIELEPWMAYSLPETLKYWAVRGTHEEERNKPVNLDKINNLSFLRRELDRALERHRQENPQPQEAE